MWKKDDEQPQRPTPTPTTATVSRPEQSQAQARKAGFATIGPSIVIRGEVTGDEDLLIQGQIDGSVTLGLHSVTIGDGGRVKAGISGRVITVEGAVEGDLKAQEQIILRGTAHVKGDLNAPRVVLEDGATFRGLVDMGKKPELEPPEPRPGSTGAKPTSPTEGKEGATAQRDAKATSGAPEARGPQGAGRATEEADKNKNKSPSGAGKPAGG